MARKCIINKLKCKLDNSKYKDKYKILNPENDIIRVIISIGGIEIYLCGMEIYLKGLANCLEEYEKKLIQNDIHIQQEFEEEKHRCYVDELSKQTCELNDIRIDSEITKKQSKREKVNKLRILRLNDLELLYKIRDGNFDKKMILKYKFLKEQHLTYQYEYYIDESPIRNSNDFKRINNEKLIQLFKITREEQKQMKSIIDKEEKKRRKNLKRRQDRRDQNGLTNIERKKKSKEKEIKKILDKNPNITKSKVAQLVGLSKSSISKTYKYLF